MPCHTRPGWADPGNGYRVRVADQVRGVLLLSFYGGHLDLGLVHVLLATAVVHFVAYLRLLRSGSKVGVHAGGKPKTMDENPPRQLRQLPMYSCHP